MLQRAIRSFHIAYNKTIHLYFLDDKFKFLGICCSRLYSEEMTTFFWFRTNWFHFEGFQGYNSSKQGQIEVNFWSQVVLIIVQMPFKVFWKTWIFTETRHTQSLNFCSNFDLNLPPEDGQNQKKVKVFKGKYLVIRLSKSIKIKALYSFNFQWKL